MKVSKRLLNITLITLALLALLFVFGYVNSLVSYKYEVEDYIHSSKTLDAHQHQIINDIANCKLYSFLCFGLFMLLFFVRLKKPALNGRLVYTK